MIYKYNENLFEEIDRNVAVNILNEGMRLLA